MADGLFEPADLRVVQDVFDEITAEPWCSRGVAYREELARYVMSMYRRGLILPGQLKELCRTAAWNKFSAGKSDIKGYRFLIVEDEYVTAREASEMLTELGADIVGPVSRVADAVDLIEHGPELDGALLDINLDGEMVYPAAAMLKMKRVPFAFVTAYEDRVLPTSYRSVKVFTKPASWGAIASYLARERDIARPHFRDTRIRASGRCSR
ncbi:hypothetical protein JNB88_28990 [Rhizobium cauense]|uniref:hypothetical protein n=1 Tax=Rhizobium cauense TaxID=1166683 RepID=UPI001C6E712B|nr:hypothetical protein [Rhizobium cauense]MBW9117661.1 hypothetical protein [Rhizobium cauense]